MEIIDKQNTSVKIMTPNYMKPMEEDREKLMRNIDEYFAICKGQPLVDNTGKVVLDKFDRPVYINSKIPTVTGLALHLGLRTRQRLLNYARNGLNADIIKVGLSMIEEYAEMRLYDKNGSKGAMFSLCNSFNQWTQLDRDETSQEALNKLDAILEATKKNAIANGTNTLMINGKEVAIDITDRQEEEIENKIEEKEVSEEAMADIETSAIGK